MIWLLVWPALVLVAVLGLVIRELADALVFRRCFAGRGSTEEVLGSGALLFVLTAAILCLAYLAVSL